MKLFIDTARGLSKLRGLSDAFDERKIRAAVARVINKTAVDGRQEAIKSIRSEYNIAARYPNKIQIRKATSRNPDAGLYASRVPLPLNMFSPKFETQTRSQRTTKKGKKKVSELRRKRSNPARGVSVEVYKGSRKVIPFAFMIPTAKPHVFARGAYRTGGRYGFVRRHKRDKSSGADRDIAPMITITLNAMIINKKVVREVRKKVLSAVKVHAAEELKQLYKIEF